MRRKYEEGPFGPIYSQFVRKPKSAIIHLLKVQKGECVKALFRDDIGYIDIVWGENDPKTHKGYGLKHIYEKHGNSIMALGFKIEDFIPIVVQFGDFNIKKSDTEKRVYESNQFRFVIAIDHRYQKKWLLTAFDLKTAPKK